MIRAHDSGVPFGEKSTQTMSEGRATHARNRWTISFSSESRQRIKARDLRDLRKEIPRDRCRRLQHQCR